MGENSELSQALSSIIWEVIQKNLQITEMHLFATLEMLNALDGDNDRGERSSSLRKLNILRQESYMLIEQNLELIKRANTIFNQNGLPDIYFKNSIQSIEYKINIFVDSDEWQEEFTEYLDIMEQNLLKFSECCTKTRDRLDALNS